METVKGTNTYSRATLLSGKTVTLGPCSNVLELKVRACQQFTDFLPQQVKVFDTNANLVEDHLPAPPSVTVGRKGLIDFI